MIDCKPVMRNGGQAWYLVAFILIAATLALGKQTLDPRIPSPDQGKYRDIKDAKDWQNPFVVINADGVYLWCKAVGVEQKRISLDELASALKALPIRAWPYGTVVGAAENGVRGVNDSPLIRRNRAIVEKTLTELGVTISWWPSG